MAQDRFLIGYNDNNSGIQSDVKPWIITDNAFEQLRNVYVLRGRVRKRFGTVLMSDTQLGSRLRLDTSASYGAGVYSGTVPGNKFEIGQMFSVNDDTFTVFQTGTPGAMIASNPTTSGTFDTTTGAFTITGETSGLIVYFYPATPVMGLTRYYVESTNSFNTMGWDTQFSYQFDPVALGWYRLTAGQSVWTGTDYQFFWSLGFQAPLAALNTLWVTNFNIPDGIRYWNNSTWTKPVINYTKGSVLGSTDGSGNAAGVVPGASGFIGQVFTIGLTTFTVVASSGALTPASNSTGGPTGTGTFNTATGAYTFTGAFHNTSIYFTGENYLQTALIIVQFKNRLLFLNTIELANNVSEKFPYRCRYSAINDPIASSSFMADFPGNGGFTDAPTDEAIVTAQFVKDRLIVYFDSSTFELVYTNNQVQPFIWQKLDNELGAISTYSEVSLNKVIFGIDDNGIHACNGANVDRIDDKIPQYPFSISNDQNGSNRVAGVRDYYNEMIYWTIPTVDRSDSFYFPNQVLVYNYVNQSWATIEDSFTTFGYFLLPPNSDGLTWGQTTSEWGNIVQQWNSNFSTSVNTTTKSIIAGNQQGFVQILQPDVSSNCASLQVTGFNFVDAGRFDITSINHNLRLNDFVLLTNVNGVSFTDSRGNTLNQIMGRVSNDPINSDTPNSFQITSLDNFSQPISAIGGYTGGGNIARVSNVNILSKQYNFYTERDRNIYLSKVDFLVDRTDSGAVTVDYLVSSTPISLISEGIGNIASPGPLPGDGTLETSAYELSNFEKFQSRLWHPIYMYAEGECVQLQIFMSPNQMYSYKVNCDGTTSYKALNDFQMHAMIFHVSPTSSRMQ